MPWLCFAAGPVERLKDPILKERLFGLTGPEGNHGEDVKEQYFFLDCTPTHSYMKAQQLQISARGVSICAALVGENRRRTLAAIPEYEILDTGTFNEGRYF